MILQQFDTSQVIKIYYILTLRKFRRVFSFTGLCTDFNKKKKTFTLQNYYGNELIKLNFPIFSPNILNTFFSKNYNFKKKKSKLRTFKKIKFTSKTSNYRLFFKKNKILDALNYIYLPKTLLITEKRRLLKKFRL